MTRTYEKDDRPVISTKSTSPNFQARPFAPPQSDVSQVNQTTEGQSIQVKSLLPENLLGKGIFTPKTESSGRPVQRDVLFSRRTPVQAKLNIGEPDDKYEKEADTIAAKVVQQINSSLQENSVPTQEGKEDSLQRSPKISKLQRQASVEEEEEDLQRSPLIQRREKIGGGEASEDLESSIQSARGGGQSLDSNLQVKMGQAMGADFSRVKVHTDARSDQLNKSIQAKAFTTGQDVFFRQGVYQPSSRGGQELIAHELTHVVQQNGGACRLPSLSKNTSLILQSKGEILQRLIDKEGMEITLAMIEVEQNLETLKEWAALSGDGDWEDLDLLKEIQQKIVELQPKSLAILSNEETVDIADEETVDTPDAPIPSSEVPKKKKFVKPPATPPAPLKKGWVRMSQLPKGGGTNKTKSWGEFPHVSVLMGTVDVKKSLVEIEDIHWSKGASDTHFHWVSKGGGNYKFSGDPNRFPQSGRDLLKKAYIAVNKKGLELGLNVVCPPGIDV